LSYFRTASVKQKKSPASPGMVRRFPPPTEKNRSGAEALLCTASPHVGIAAAPVLDRRHLEALAGIIISCLCGIHP
jgi:hypothetical protein